MLVFFCALIYCTNAAALDITVTIDSPLNGDTFELGQTVYFSGKGTIATSDYPLSGSDLVWMSSLDGKIGIGTFFSTNKLSVGHHTITLIAENQAAVSMGIDVTIPTSPSTPPVTTGDYATYNMATNTLYIPYSPVLGVSYWVNMSITSFSPLQLQITGVGENTYSASRAYATFSLFTGTLHVPDYRDTSGDSYWFNLQMDPSATPLQFELGGAGLN